MKEKNILLINPWIYDFKAYDLWMKPLGLLYIASILKEEGYRINFIDCLNRNHKYIPSDFKKKVSIYGNGSYYYETIIKPDFYSKVPRKYKRYGIPIDAFIDDLKNIQVPSAILVTSMMTYWYPGVFEIIRIVKEFFGDIPVILGGIYCNLCNEHARNFSGADYIIKNEETGKLLEVLSEMTGNKIKKKYVSFKDFPAPAYEFIESCSYIPLLTSIGCPLNCSYCASKVLYPEFCQFDPDKVFNMMTYSYKTYGIKNISFYDDALLVNFSEHLEKILKLVIFSGLQINLHAPNALHARMLNDSNADMLRKAGFKTIRLGLEFSDPLLQISTGGKVTNQEIESAIQCLLRAGFENREIGVYIMVGTPGQKTEDIDNALRLISKCGVLSKIVEYSPIPYTKTFLSFPGNNDPAAKDPLFHNNTFHIYNSTIISLEDYIELRRLSNKFNRELASLSY